MKNISSKIGSNIWVVIVICITLVLLSSIGAWVHVQQQQLAQQDRGLRQEKELEEYKQKQMNKRQHQECIQNSSDDEWGWFRC